MDEAMMDYMDSRIFALELQRDELVRAVKYLLLHAVGNEDPLCRTVFVEDVDRLIALLAKLEE